MLNENLAFERSCDVTFDLSTNCKISGIFEKVYPSDHQSCLALFYF